jgi:hypothetical protein
VLHCCVEGGDSSGKVEPDFGFEGIHEEVEDSSELEVSIRVRLVRL